MRWFALPTVLASLAAASACTGSTGAAAVPIAAPVPVAPPPADPSSEEPAAPAPAGENRTEIGPLVLDGTPPIPAEVRERLRPYLEQRSATLADMADDGSAVLVSTRFGETYQIHRVDTPLGMRQQLTFLPEPVTDARFVPKGAGAMVYAADVGGDEKYQLFRVDPRTGRRVQLTDEAGRNLAMVWSDDGNHLVWASTARNGRDYDIWMSDGKDPDSRRLVAQGSGMWFPLDISGDGKRILVGEYVSINESRLHVVDVASGKVTRISPEGTASYIPAAFGAGKTVYVVSDREGEFRQLYETDVTGSSWKSLTTDIRWDVEHLAVDPAGRQVAFAVNEGGYSTLSLLDARRRRATAVSIPRGVIGALSFASARTLAFDLNQPTRSTDVYSYDLRSRKVTTWTASEMGGLRAEDMIAPELIEFSSFDGIKVPAFYYRPRGDGPFPVVILIHGGPEGQARPNYSASIQYLVRESGFAVLEPNVRGSAGYGKTYLTLDNAEKREDSVKDIGALLDWIAQQQELRADKVAVLGGSYGGYMVLASLVKFSDRIVAGVDVVGISSFVTFLENTSEYRRDLRRVEYGDERDPEMRKFLEEISPLNHAGEIDAALFVAQGANDPRVPASEAEQIVAAVRARGKDVWYMLARDEGHGFKKRANSDVYRMLLVMFLDKHLR